jgi:hypothetical protein
MIRNTDSYVILRRHSQQMLDFAVLVCTATPQLKHALAAHEADSTSFLATNASFPASEVPYSTEKRSLNGYTTVLGANLLLSVFSYFETYFFAAFDEVISFHGGEKEIEAAIKRQLRERIHPPEVTTALNGLRSPYKPQRADKFRKHTAALKNVPMAWPSQRFMLYGLKQAIAQRPRWKSVDIPKLALEIFGVDLADQERDRFHSIRNDRNKIAHGKNLSHDLRKAVDACYFLKNFALKIDICIVKNALLLERYAH